MGTLNKILRQKATNIGARFRYHWQNRSEVPMQRRLLLVSMMAAAIATTGNAALGSSAAESAVRRFQEVTANMSADHPSYPYQVQRLAIELFQAGEREKSDEQFENFRKALATRPNTQIELLEGLLEYADAISNLPKDFGLPSGAGIEKYQEAVRNEMPLHQKDVAKAEALVLEAGQLIDSLAPFDANRPRQMTRMEKFYRKIKNNRLADEWSAKMDQVIDVALKSDSLKPAQVDVCLRLLSIRAMEGNFGSGWGVATAAAPTPQIYERTAGYVEQMSLLLKKFPVQSTTEASYLRDFYWFYTRNGKAELAETNKKKLETLLGSTDPNVLFPPRKQCFACGMG